MIIIRYNKINPYLILNNILSWEGYMRTCVILPQRSLPYRRVSTHARQKHENLFTGKN